MERDLLNDGFLKTSPRIKLFSTAVEFLYNSVNLGKFNITISNSPRLDEVVELQIVDKETGDAEWVLEWDKTSEEQIRISIPFELCALRVQEIM